MRKFSFCGIFATLFVTTTIILLASCSQDDDYYESDMYTLAEMETRLGDPEQGGGNGYDQEFPITRSIGWKINKNDSIAIISCPVNLILRYDHFNNGGSVVYNGHANESIINVVVRGGNCYKVRDKLSYRVTLSADYIDQHDSSPNDTIAVEAYIDGSINMYLK